MFTQCELRLYHLIKKDSFYLRNYSHTFPKAVNINFLNVLATDEYLTRSWFKKPEQQSDYGRFSEIHHIINIYYNN